MQARSDPLRSGNFRACRISPTTLLPRPKPLNAPLCQSMKSFGWGQTHPFFVDSELAHSGARTFSPQSVRRLNNGDDEFVNGIGIRGSRMKYRANMERNTRKIIYCSGEEGLYLPLDGTVFAVLRRKKKGYFARRVRTLFSFS